MNIDSQMSEPPHNNSTNKDTRKYNDYFIHKLIVHCVTRGENELFQARMFSTSWSRVLKTSHPSLK